MKRGKWVLRLAAGVVMFAALAGPAPGNVGGCGTVPTADARSFCVDKKYWECRRDEFAGRINAEESAACMAMIDSTCGGFAWPDGCVPTTSQTDACILLLQSQERADLTNEQIYANYTECNICM